MSKARQLADNGAATPNRNMVINGAMNVAQRATSVTGIGANAAAYHTLDRWMIETTASAGRLTMSQTADGPVGFANCIKLDCTTADTSIAAGEFLLLEHKIEGQNVQRIGKGVAGAKQVTISFYVKANAAFDFVLEFFDADHSRACNKLFSTTTDWVRQEITFPADVDDGSSPFGDDNAASVRLFFWLHGGSTYTGGTLQSGSFVNTTQANRAAGIDSFYSSTDNNFFITGVQMEVGAAATPFEHKTFAQDLAECQRYLYKWIVDSGAAFNFYATGFAFSTTKMTTVGSQGVPMRAASTFTTSGDFRVCSGSSCVAVTALALGQGNKVTPTIESTIGSTAFTLSEAWGLGDNNDTDAYLQFDAEL